MPHWIAFPDINSSLFRYGDGVESTYAQVKDSFNTTYPTNCIIQDINFSDEDAEAYGDIISKLLKGRYAYETLI